MSLYNIKKLIYMYVNDNNYHIIISIAIGGGSRPVGRARRSRKGGTAFFKIQVKFFYGGA